MSNEKDNLIEGINYALEVVDGSVSILLMNSAGVYAARDKYGRTPISIGKKEDAFCAAFEKFAYKNLGFREYGSLNPIEFRYTLSYKFNYFFSAGIGTGIRRCISLGIKPEFKNDENLNEFVIVIPRLDENGNQVTKSNRKSNQVPSVK